MIHKGNFFYRARVFNVNDPDVRPFSCASFEGFDEENSLAPKPNKVKNPGRVNEINESVLYIAEDEYTAMAEARTGKRQTISMAEVELLKDIEVFEFKYTESSLKDNSLEQIYQFIALEYYLTVYDDDKRQYMITQYIARKLKEIGFDGVKYSSSLSEKGMNIAIFNPNKVAKANNSKLYLTKSVLYYAERMKNEKNNGKLIPKSITDKFTWEEIDYFFSRME